VTGSTIHGIAEKTPTIGEEGGTGGTGGTGPGNNAPIPTPNPRAPVTLWKLMVWAYRIQMVQYETDRAFEYRGTGSFADELLGYRSGIETVRGCINAAGTTAHEDAHLLHSYVRALHPRETALLIDAAAKASIPDWDPELPKFRVIPSRKPGGNLRMVWSKKGQPIGCQIEYAGIPEAEAEAMRRHARKVYSAWWKAMRTVRCRLLFERRLTKWRIVGLGAPCEPWTQGGNKSPYKAGAWQ
jgi:hypothetical protein